jgi:transposase
VQTTTQTPEENSAEPAGQSARITALEAENRWLKEENLLLRRRLWGRSSEKSVIEVSPDQWQLVFNEAEACAVDAPPEPEVTTIESYQRKRGRKRLPDNLERVSDVHDLTESEKVCPHDGAALQVIGKEVSEQYHFQPARAWINEEVRLTYACPCCHGYVKTAPGPLKLLPKSVASPELLAHVTTTKFEDAVPLHRQVKQLERYGIELSVATLSNWMVAIGTAHVQPLINLLLDLLMKAALMHMDETTLQVLRSEKSATADHYMWVRLAILAATDAESERQIAIFTYSPYRNAETLQQLLDGFSGKLITDGLDLYDTYADQKELTHGCCNAHARRGFEEARQIACGEGKKSKKAAMEPDSSAARAKVALEYYRQIYKIERDIKDLTPDQKVVVRQQRSAPIMGQFKSWLDELHPKVWPESKLGKAIAYALRRWDKLCMFLEHGDMDPDNNAVERVIRQFVIGRNNWMLHKSQAGATASANLYSLLITCRINNIDAHAYLTYLFTHLPAASTIEDFEALLPWNVQRILDKQKGFAVRSRAPPD